MKIENFKLKIKIYLKKVVIKITEDPPKSFDIYFINPKCFSYFILFGPIRPITPFLPEGRLTPETIIE